MQNNLPPSCCQRPAGDTTCKIGDPAVAPNGCKGSFEESLKSSMVTVAGLGIGVALVEVWMINFTEIILYFVQKI